MNSCIDSSRIEVLARLSRTANEDVLGKVARGFLDQTPQRVALLREALTAGDAEAASLLAHTLKGSASNLGATRLAELCAKGEALAEAGDVVGCLGYLPLIEKECGLASSALGEFTTRVPLSENGERSAGERRSG